MSKTRDTGFLGNVIKVDTSGNVSFVSGSTTLATINTSGQLSGSSPVLSSSYALNADLLDGLDSTQFTLTSSFAAQTASFTAYTASQNILNGTYATTGSNTFVSPQTINSNLVVTGSITAQTLVVQTITSSVDFVTGSTRFGSILGNTHVFSGSVTMNPGGLFVSSSGNVGIGNIIPAYKLDVSGSGRFISYLDLTGGASFGPQLNIFSNNQSTNNITLAQGYANGTDNIGYLYNRATADFVFGTSNIERMRITSGGNVGIGYISPTVALQVSGTIAVGNATTTGWGRFSYDVATNQVRIQASKDGTDSISLSFYTQASGGGFAERMIISGSNVGIGTSSPNYPLQINSTNGAVRLTLQNSDNTGYLAFTEQDIRMWRPDGSGASLTIATQAITGTFGGAIIFSPLNAEKMRIGSSGLISIVSNVEIGNGYLSTSAGSGTTYSSKLFTSYSYPYIDTYLDSVAGASYEGRIIFRTNTGGGSFGNRMIIYNSGAVVIQGALSKGSGSFRIKHPLASKKNTHQLVHSFIEGPQADLIYSGEVTLVDGKATINIDEAATMTEGTFEALNRNIRVFTSNETSWDNVRGKVVGNILTIECQNTESTDEISWMVIGERQDEHIMDTEWTDENGKVIVEPLIPEEITTT